MNIVILGAGPTGLGAGYQCHRSGLKNWSVFESSNVLGGLSASFLDPHGFTWDVGGHVLFSHYPFFDHAVSEALGNDYLEHLRESWIRVRNTWVPYPFQNNIHHLDSDVLQECLDGLRNRRANTDMPKNFREWIIAVFGNGIYKFFMEPYNSKVWGIPLDEMSKDWISERISLVDSGRIEKNIAEKRDDVGWGPNSKFIFPKKGGTGAIFNNIARPFHDRIFFNHRCSHVDLDNRTIRFSNDQTVSYDVLISTIPLDLFVHLCSGIPKHIRSTVQGLKHNSGLIVGLGFSGRRNDSKCWMYFPEDTVPFYRVTNFHNYSPYNVPNGDIDRYYSLMCETTYSCYKAVDKNAIVDLTISGLIACGMLTENDANKIVSKYLIDIPYSYPIPTLGRDAALSAVQPYLESKFVYSRGRFGAWKYEVGNMDHSFMQGVEVVNRVLFGEKETVLRQNG
jgi:protoporphyrinogen oxidase